jgi:hypothetical protein
LAMSRSTAATTPDTPGAVRRLLAADPGALLLAEVEGRLVGALIASSDGWRGSVPARRRPAVPQARHRAAPHRLR